MAYNNNYNKNNQNRSNDTTSTNGFVLINESAGKILEFNFFGKTAAINIGVCPSGAPIDWDARKNAQRISTNPPFSSICDILDMCEYVMDTIKGGDTSFKSIAVEIPGKNTIVEISNGENIKLPIGLYFVIYKNVDVGKKTNTMEFYPFNGIKYFYGYDHTTGISRIDYSKTGEFKKFIRGLRESANAFTMAHAHVSCEVKKNEKMATYKALSAIGASLGVDMTSILNEAKTTNSNKKPYNGGTSGGYNKYPNNRQPYGQNNGGYNNGGGGYNQNHPTMANNMMDEPVDINLDMAGLTNVNPSNFS